MWWRYNCFDKGISPREARKTYVREIREIFAIKNAITERKASLQEIQDMMNKIR